MIELREFQRILGAGILYIGIAYLAYQAGCIVWPWWKRRRHRCAICLRRGNFAKPLADSKLYYCGKCVIAVIEARAVFRTLREQAAKKKRA